MQALEREILGLFAGDGRLGLIRQNVRRLDAILGSYAEELRDRLDAAANAPDAERPGLHRQAGAVLKRYRDYIRGDKFVKDVAANPLHPVDLATILGSTLDTLGKKLGN